MLPDLADGGRGSAASLNLNGVPWIFGGFNKSNGYDMDSIEYFDGEQFKLWSHKYDHLS